MDLKERLSAKLKGLSAGSMATRRVVLLPDCYVDRLIYVKDPLPDFLELIRKTALSGGGAIHGYPQEEVRGGNAANTAAALASLGFKPVLICVTDTYGKRVMEEFFKGSGVRLRVKEGRGCSMTVSFEIPTERGHVNVMFGYPGPLADFGPEALDEDDLKLIREAEVLGLFNWARNVNKGTELFESVGSYFKREGAGVLYADMADPSARAKELPTFIERVLLPRLVDYLSLNEKEASDLCKAASGREAVEKPLDAALELSEILGINIVFHTVDYSSLLARGEVKAVVPAFRVRTLKATGAGDVFNAGFMAGLLLGLSPEESLLMGNACAGYYLSKGRTPTLSELTEFLASAKLKGGEGS